MIPGSTNFLATVSNYYIFFLQPANVTNSARMGNLGRCAGCSSLRADPSSSATGGKEMIARSHAREEIYEQ